MLRRVRNDLQLDREKNMFDVSGAQLDVVSSDVNAVGGIKEGDGW